MRPATLTWFAGHEWRLVWRDGLSMLSAGRRSRGPVLAVVVMAFALLAHLLANFIIAPVAETGIRPDKMTLVMVAGGAFISWTLMLSQAIESVTRAFYTRGDLDLILSSPASARRLFAVRMAAIALSTTLLTTVIAGPFINVAAVLDGARWLAGYGVLCAMGAFSTALAVVVTVVLFHILGPKRTRLVAQIVSAVVAAAFVIGVQAAAIFASGSFSRLALFRSESFIAVAPEADSLVYWPARAAMGDATALAVVLAISLGLLGLVIAVFSASFETHVGVTLDAADQATTRRRPLTEFRAGSTMSALRRKEWALLRRDPWLLSQTLMQIFYLLPPILLLWLNFGDGAGALLLLVPVLVMAAGQLAGGLAWIAVSGEDAPDLVASAPITAYAIIVAKIQAVLGAVAVVVAPLLAALVVAAPKLAVVAALGIVVSAWSGTMIQFWFRPQSAPGRLRRRRIPSRIATVAEALSAILWAGTAAVAAAGSWLASVTALVAILVVAGAWMIRPRHDNGA